MSISIYDPHKKHPVKKRNVDYEKIYALFDSKKMSMAAVARELSISPGSVQHALRIRKKGLK